MTEKVPSSVITPNPNLSLGVYSLVIILGLFALKYASLVFVPILGGFVFAFLLNPLLHHMGKWTGLRRSVCAAVIVSSIFISMIAILIPLVPYLMGKITASAVKLPQTLTQFSDKVQIFNDYLAKNFPDFVGKLDLMNQIERTIQSFLGNVSEHFLELFTNLYGVITLVAYIVLIPLFAFFILRDYYTIKSFIFTLVPPRQKNYFINKLMGLNQILAAYIRGQTIVVILLSILYSIGLSLIGFPFPVVIGIFSGLGDIIPYFGTVVGLIVSLIVGYVHFHSMHQLMLILMVFFIIKAAENWFIYPKIVGFRVGLPFVWAILSFITFGKVFGFWGLLVAIPCSAGFKVFLLDVFDRYRKSAYFNKETN